MAGFIRRFTEFPPVETLTQIEGVNIIDLPPPASIAGVGSGTMCLVGEFADMTYAADVNAAGTITTKYRPQEVFSAQDLLTKVGGFDSTLGQFGGDMGNGFVELRNKTFSRLIVIPVALFSAAGIRVWRKLPTNKSATDPTPVVVVSAAAVDAGREFRNGLDRLKVASRVVYADTVAYASGTDGSTTNAAAAATQTFDATSGAFVARGVVEGDILVLGQIGGAGALGSNADTYRIVSVTDADTLVVQKMDGSNFAFATGASQPWRIHKGNVADSGPLNQFSEQAGYTVLARPLTNGAGTGSSATDGTWTASQLLTPLVAPPALTADSADPLSGLAAAISPTTTFTFTTLLQKPNAANDSVIDVVYSAAIDALLEDAAPAREVNHVWAARKSNTIRAKLKSHCLTAAGVGIGRTCAVSPELDLTLSSMLATVTGDSAPGVGANRDERLDYNWPGALTFVPEAVGLVLATADGKTTEDGILDTTADGWFSAILSNIAPERNPGEASSTVRKVMAPVLGFARNTPTLGINEYKLLRQRGIASLRMDRTSGPIFQSGITTSLISGQKNVNRRRMADFIEDSLAQRYNQLAKLPLTNSLKDTIVTETEEFLAELLSANNPPAQRISAYQIDDISGNTPALEAKGVFVIIVKVRTLATADFITLQAEIGEGVQITTT